MTENAVNTEQGIILEALNYKADLDGNNLTGTGFEDYIKSLGAGGDGYIVAEYHGENDWYYIFKDGRCLQGGKYYGTITFDTNGQTFTVPYILPISKILRGDATCDEYYKKYAEYNYTSGKYTYKEISGTNNTVAVVSTGSGCGLDGVILTYSKSQSEEKVTITNVEYYVEGVVRS